MGERHSDTKFQADDCNYELFGAHQIIRACLNSLSFCGSTCWKSFPFMMGESKLHRSEFCGKSLTDHLFFQVSVQ